MNRICVLIIILLFPGCYNYDVDTFEKHCERIMLTDRGQDQLEYHAPFWAILPSITFHSDAIRDDFVKYMNTTHMEKAQNLVDRMAWREGFDFHLVNISTVLDIDPNETIEFWRTGIDKAKNNAHKDLGDKCFYDTIAAYFDSMKIHSMQSDALGIKWTDSVSEIPTDRQERYRKLGWSPP